MGCIVMTVDAFQDGYGVAMLLVARLEFAHALDGELDDWLEHLE